MLVGNRRTDTHSAALVLARGSRGCRPAAGRVRGPMSAAADQTTLVRRRRLATKRDDGDHDPDHGLSIATSSGSRADRVTVTRRSAATHTMVPDGIGDWRHGVTFRWSGTLPGGTHAVVISSARRDTTAAQATLAAGTRHRSRRRRRRRRSRRPPRSRRREAHAAPDAEADAQADPDADPDARRRPRTATAPSPTPRPDATADPAADAAQACTAADRDATRRSPTADPTPTADRLAGAPTVGPTPGDPPRRRSDAAPSRARPIRRPERSARWRSSPAPTRAAGPVRRLDRRLDSRPARDDRSTAASRPGAGARSPAVMAIAGLRRPDLPAVGARPTLVTTTGGRRRGDGARPLRSQAPCDDEPPDEGVLATAAAAGVGGIAPGVGLPGARASPVIAGRSRGADRPRRRRHRAAPAALAATVAAPGPQGRSDPRRRRRRPRLTFDQGLVGPLDGHERRVIRYRVVRLLDSPDELRGAEIGYLDQGDEVQLLEKYGAYWLVLCPDGRQGWLHKMTLGDVVDEEAAAGLPGRHDAARRRRRGRWASRTSTATSSRPTSSRAAGERLTRGVPCAAPGCAGGRCSGRTARG